MIRTATHEDRNAIVLLLRESHAAAGLPFKFSAPHADALADGHIADDDKLALLLVQDKPCGVLLASCQPHPFAAVRYAFETVWWIAPDSRGHAASDMLDAYEEWAKSKGCVFAGMAALDAFPRAGTIYKRRGYAPTETHFLKPL